MDGWLSSSDLQTFLSFIERFFSGDVFFYGKVQTNQPLFCAAGHKELYMACLQQSVHMQIIQVIFFCRQIALYVTVVLRQCDPSLMLLLLFLGCMIYSSIAPYIQAWTPTRHNFSVILSNIASETQRDGAKSFSFYASQLRTCQNISSKNT